MPRQPSQPWSCRTVLASAVTMVVLVVDENAGFVRWVLFSPGGVAAFGTALDGALARYRDRQGV